MVTRSDPAPGWYSDPLGTGLLRAWDGSHWTTQTRTAEDVSPVLGGPSTRGESEPSLGATLVTTPALDQAEPESSAAELKPSDDVTPWPTSRTPRSGRRRRDG